VVVEVSTTRSRPPAAASRLALAGDPVDEAPVPCEMAASAPARSGDEHGVGRFEEQARRVALAVEFLDHRREVGGERPAAHVLTTAMRVISPRAVRRGRPWW
jgi:hypothetical protein